MRPSRCCLQALALIATFWKIEGGNGSQYSKIGRQQQVKDKIDVPLRDKVLQRLFGDNTEAAYPSAQLLCIPPEWGGKIEVSRGAVRVAWRAVKEYINWHNKSGVARDDEEALQRLRRKLCNPADTAPSVCACSSVER